MPYKNIIFVKFRLELLKDERFTDRLDDSGKLLYMGLLLLAGSTNNLIPNNPTYIKRNLNLRLSEDEISLKIAELLGVFKKLSGNSQYLKFKNFNKIHNWIGNSKGTPRECQDKIRIDKKRIDKILERYITLKNLDNDISQRPELLRQILKTNYKAIEGLLTMAKDDAEAMGALEWLASQDWANKYDWSMWLVTKKFPDYLRTLTQPVSKWNML